MYTIRTHRLLHEKKKKKKTTKNDGSHAEIVIIVGGKPLMTINNLAGPVGK